MGDGWEQVKDRLFQESPELRQAYEESEPAYLLSSAMLRARSDLGITQAELARRMGTSQSVVSRLENMDSSPTLRTVVKVAKALGCEVELRFVRREAETEAEVLEAEVLPAIGARPPQQWVDAMREIVREEVQVALRQAAPPIRGDRGRVRRG